MLLARTDNQNVVNKILIDVSNGLYWSSSGVFQSVVNKVSSLLCVYVCIVGSFGLSFVEGTNIWVLSVGLMSVLLLYEIALPLTAIHYNLWNADTLLFRKANKFFGSFST